MFIATTGSQGYNVSSPVGQNDGRAFRCASCVPVSSKVMLKGNMNQILEEKPTIISPYFVYHMPKWAALSLKGVLFLFGIATAYLAFHEQANTPLVIIGFLYFLSGCFLLSAFHPKTGREKIYFICDHLGMYFPSYQSQMLFPRGNTERWLFVPWINIKNIKAERLLDGDGITNGLAISVKASEEEERLFFGELAVMKQRLLSNKDAEGNLIVGYSNIFQKTDGVVSTLKRYMH